MAGELAHMTGFWILLLGVYRFVGGQYRRWNLGVLGLWLIFWLAGIALIRSHTELGIIVVKLARTLLFLGAGGLILTRIPNRSLAGRQFAGWGLVAWAGYVALTAFVKLPDATAWAHLQFGFLVGFQILATLGLVVLVVDHLRIRAENSEIRVDKLEGLLPICSYCKKIRDPQNNWYPVEQFIEERSKADFTHGICPECIEKHFPGLETKA